LFIQELISNQLSDWIDNIPEKSFRVQHFVS
jgi:hypothetical protein